MHINVDANFECSPGNGLRKRRSSANSMGKVDARLVVALNPPLTQSVAEKLVAAALKGVFVDVTTSSRSALSERRHLPC